MDRALDLAVLAIRPYEARDLSALYAICLRTGAAGQDATSMVDDPTLFGELFAAPYAVLEPEHALVLADDGATVLGYALGALDTCEFEARCATEWWPIAQERHPLTTGGRRLDDLLLAMIHAPHPAADATVERYPSHVHIDLLPEAQGAGWGRRMMEALFARLAEDGSTGVHWGVSRANESALGFYRHLGATQIAEDAMTHRFGWPLP